jgi:hypothetical protein
MSKSSGVCQESSSKISIHLDKAWSFYDKNSKTHEYCTHYEHPYANQNFLPGTTLISMPKKK